MRGPVIFLVGAALAAAAAAVVVWPAYQERSTLRESLLDAASSEPTRHADTWRLSNATRDLEDGLGSAAEDPEGAVTRIAGEMAPGSTVGWSAGSLEVTLPWEDLPALLSGLSGPGAPPFLRISAGPAEDGESCLITLVPEDTTGR
jgi:hypothetical protein